MVKLVKVHITTLSARTCTRILQDIFHLISTAKQDPSPIK